jgi:5'-phosphate synthase pdxT subunit
MKIGAVGLQGAISEHLEAVKQSMENLKITGEVVWIKKFQQLGGIDGIIIPGGESTTIGKLMLGAGLFNEVKRLGEEGLPILGTCAGLVLLAKKGDEQIIRTRQPLLELMDMKVVRNAFGRQRESFEADLDIPILGEKPFRGVFIRAPAVERVWRNARVIAKFQGKIVGVQQRNLIAVAFHPELTHDLRLHKYFIQSCR